jgi:hypothetical protein
MLRRRMNARQGCHELAAMTGGSPLPVAPGDGPLARSRTLMSSQFASAAATLSAPLFLSHFTFICGSSFASSLSASAGRRTLEFFCRSVDSAIAEPTGAF